MADILVVDDDPHIVEVICFALDKAEHSHRSAANGIEALEVFQDQRADLIVLDVGMPEMDGLEVCRQIRKNSDVPILFLSARDDEIDRILGLEIGGDDYVTKPFSPRELMARINVILKRSKADNAAHHKAGEQNPVLQSGRLALNADERSVRFDGAPVKMTAIEFNILHALLCHPRMVFSRNRILDSAYPDNIHVSDRTIDSHIRNIRAKLAKSGCAEVIETVHGVGFRLGNCNLGNCD